jgi:hypothetical protein
MNAIASMLQRIQQTILDFPGNQLSGGVVFESWRPEMLNSRNLCFGKDNDLDVHKVKSHLYRQHPMNRRLKMAGFSSERIYKSPL